MATTQNGIYYPSEEDFGNESADVLNQMKLIAESVDEGIEESKYDDTEIKDDIAAQNEEIEALQTKITDLEETVNSELEDGTAEGTEITVNDSAVADASLLPNGNIELTQKTYKGMFRIPETINRTVSGLTFKVNDDGSVTITGTSTSPIDFYLDLPTSVTFTQGYYTFCVKAVGTTGSTSTSHKWTLRDANSSRKFYVNVEGGKTNYESTNMSATQTVDMLQITIGNRQTLDCTIYPILDQGTTVRDWDSEPTHTVDASPDYPQDIHVVKPSVQLFDKDNANIINASIDASNGNMRANDDFRTIYIPCESNTTYTVSKIITNRFIVAETNEETITLPSQVTVLRSQFTESVATVTTGNTAKTLIVTLTKISEETVTLEEILNSLKIEKGTKATPWSPYGYGRTNIKIWNANMFDEILEEGRINYNTGENQTADDSIRSKNYIDVRNINSFKVIRNVATGALGIRSYDINKSFIKSESAMEINSYEKTYTINSDVAYIRFADFSNDLNAKYCITSNLSLNEYVEHKEVIKTLTLPNGMEMCKTGDYKDEFVKDLEIGKWFQNKKVGKFVLNGSEGLGFNDSGIAGTKMITFYRGDLNNRSGNYLDGYSNYFYNAKTGKANGTVRFGGNDANIYFYVDASVFSSLAIFKTWLSTHNTELYYQLATPQLIEITDETLIAELDELLELRTYYGQTNITVEAGDAKPFMTLNYKKSNRILRSEIDSIKARLELLEN